jgi:uncharacterized protein
LQRFEGRVLLSASDLANFLDCEHLTALDLAALDRSIPAARASGSEHDELVKRKGQEHEARYLHVLQARHASVVDVAAAGERLQARAAATERAMRGGADVIYQATLLAPPLLGHADFLRRVARPSALGDYCYEVLDTKLALSTRAKFLVQLALYGRLLAGLQGAPPERLVVVLGDGTEAAFRFADYARYLDNLVARLLRRVEAGPIETYPDPCERCDTCHWLQACEARRLQDDHLCQVANIRKDQTRKLQRAGLGSLQALALLPEAARVDKLAADTLDRLRKQAALQFKARQTGLRQLERLPPDPEGIRGFARLPRPDPGDLFFDMEGDPFEDGGLEYLFGVAFEQDGTERFRAFWAHSRREERAAFEQFIDFATARLRAFPGAHIYHYAHYEETALKRLMTLHGTREAEVDNLLRNHKLVDLYKVVRGGLRISEPSYGLKHVERFYFEDRGGDVRDAGASTVFYERWRQTRDDRLLAGIERYNHDDVRSTRALRDWLLRLRPADMPWANEGETREERSAGEKNEAERELEQWRQWLVDPLPQDPARWTDRQRLDELTFQLLDFHRRSDKPAWWATFSRQEATEEELVEDPECIAGLELDADVAPRPEKQSFIYTFRFPDQETKLKTGDDAMRIDTLESVGDLVVDEALRQVSFKVGPSRRPPEGRFSIGPAQPFNNRPLRDALRRYAASRVGNDGRYPAIDAFLARQTPRIAGIWPGMPIVEESAELLPQVIRAVTHLDRSYLFVQGPPGAGKTYTGSRVIVALLKQGKRVGVSSNSHKAINHLLREVEKVAAAERVSFRGAKKGTKGDADTHLGGTLIDDVFGNDDVAGGDYQLVAGTAWLFADPKLDRTIDVLFVDEAGQVALANLVAMGTSARCFVLLGDQMQLGQPIQGVHPGRSGDSALQYLLDGTATIAPDRGVFLPTTFRMHPDVCRFISEAVYDGRLRAEPHNVDRTLVLDAGAHPALRASGVRYLPVQHEGCRQRSEVEADLVRELVASLLTQRYRDKEGREHLFTLDNILVVAPYNMHVNLLRRALPAGARVGTVDKFQGQEAEVVIVSMATSSGDDLPRQIEFLYSKNRLNVAISRAKCLALFIANPALMDIRCTTPEQMALVNTLCWVRDYGGG